MHPFHKEEKTHRRAKHHKLGVHGEHDDEKAHRLCGGRYADGGDVPSKPTPGTEGHAGPWSDFAQIEGGPKVPTEKERYERGDPVKRSGYPR